MTDPAPTAAPARTMTQPAIAIGLSGLALWLLVALRADAPSCAWLGFGMAAGALGAGLSHIGGWTRQQGGGRASCIALGVLMCAPALAGALDSPAQAACWFAGGMGAQLSLGRWTRIAAGSDVEGMLKTSLVSFACASGLAAAIALGASLHPAIVPLALALAAAGAQAPPLNPDIRPPAPASDMPLPRPQASFYVAGGLLVAVLGFYFGFSHLFGIVIPKYPHAAEVAGYAVQACTALLSYFWITGSLENREWLGAFNAALVALFLVCLVALFADRADKTALISFHVGMRGFSLFLAWLAIVAFGKRGADDPGQVAGAIAGTFAGAFGLGALTEASPLFNDVLNAFPAEGIFLFSACLFVLVAYGVSTVSGFYRTSETGESPAATVVLETSFIDSQCEMLAREHGLTEREAEIAKLLCHGRSRSYIAENLYLSENTVKWYCRQIYQKLDIHKKQELLTLIGVE